MFDHNIGRLLGALARRWRSYHLWLISLGLFAFIRRAPRGIGRWLQAFTRELKTAFAAPLFGNFPHPPSRATTRGQRSTALLRPPEGSRAILPSVHAPAGFTSGVMSRIRALPTPIAAPAAQPIAALWVAPAEPLAGPGFLTPLGLFLAASLTLIVGLVTGCVVALANPSFEALMLSLMVSLLILVLGVLHIVTQTLNVVATNMWLTVPMLVTLLSVVLIAWSQIARLIGSQTVEV